ncbi:hypothetical protein C6P44_004488 [Monosporozyma unispora]|nr:hypothetical protein C6P44_004488 [Kazachstania unispora]
MSDKPERLNNWIEYKKLINRHFSYHDGANFSADTFIKTNGSQRNYREDEAESRFIHSQLHDNELAFPLRVESSIKVYLNQLDSLAINQGEVLNDNGDPLVQSIRAAQGDLEPGWSATRIANPAELLLPNEHRLFVTTDGPEIIYPNQEDLEGEHVGDIPSSKNNLGCSYGAYYFVIATTHLYIYDSVNLCSSLFKAPYLPDELLENQFDLYHMTDEDQWDSDEEETFNSSEYTANYICVRRLFDRDVLVICESRSLVLLYDLESLILDIKFASEVKLIPIVALKVPKSCWSVDIISIGDVAFVAAGHNLPGVTLFAISRSQKVIEDASHINIIAREIISEHNVPSLTFIRPEQTSPKTLSLVYCSIFGNVTTVKIDIDVSQGNIGVEFVDTQFLAEDVWTVTALKKKDFLAVPLFELLNLNFQETFKNAIQKSIIMDSKILNFQPRSIYHSDEYGIGTLTTQIPVPVSNLRWLCVDGVNSNEVKLNFTSFDKEGMVSKGTLRSLPGDSNGMFIPLSQRPYTSLERLTTDFEDDEAKFMFMYEEYLMRHRSEDSCFEDIFKKANFEIKSTSDVPNSTKYKGFSVFSTGEEYGMEINDLTEQHNVEYCPDHRDTESIFYMPKKTLIHASSIYFDKRYKKETWKDIAAVKPGLFNMTNFRKPIGIEILNSQKDWWVHNHVLKVRKLLYSAVSGYEPCGFKLPDNDNDILLITTNHSIMLAKSSPLIVTSYTVDDIFPLDSISVCINTLNLTILNRLNFICHIKELNCVAVASQTGLISLLRLTEFRGIYSFRQEYILGWKSQLPYQEDDPDCIQEIVFDQPHRGTCRSDDLVLSLGCIRGMDYKYCPEDKSVGIIEHAELIVSYRYNRQKFKIFAGDKIGNS